MEPFKTLFIKTPFFGGILKLESQIQFITPLSSNWRTFLENKKIGLKTIIADSGYIETLKKELRGVKRLLCLR